MALPVPESRQRAFEGLTSREERRTKVETMEFLMFRNTFATASNYAAGFYGWYFFAYFTEACGRGRC
ncbi:hypothetical protein [uncultured Desulfovibrio sp.]|uniref:hypothetical protein n=1 Tax=uncultured Desulfovibrio sp. TaxID=167968 RepID=UPI002637A955|nr:hypothetical protein [uncultured Desulfovibrio sp.]